MTTPRARLTLLLTLLAAVLLPAIGSERTTSMASLLALLNTTRVLDDLRALQAFGASEDGTIHRPALSTADMAARRWVASRMEAAGLQGAQIDGLGSVYGSAGVENAPALLMGSHTDSEPDGGDWLESSLGVAFALEAARVLRQGGAADLGAWAVVDWQDAGSAFGTFTASSAFVTPVFVPSKQLWEARAQVGLTSTKVMHASGRHGGWSGFLEAHTQRDLSASLGVVRTPLQILCSPPIPPIPPIPRIPRIPRIPPLHPPPPFGASPAASASERGIPRARRLRAVSSSGS